MSYRVLPAASSRRLRDMAARQTSSSNGERISGGGCHFVLGLPIHQWWSIVGHIHHGELHSRPGGIVCYQESVTSDSLVDYQVVAAIGTNVSYGSDFLEFNAGHHSAESPVCLRLTAGDRQVTVTWEAGVRPT